MPDPLIMLTQDDLKYLKDFISAQKRLQQNTPLRARVNEVDVPTPEVYIVYTPLAGIPGNTESDVGTALDDVLGYADCNLYRTVEVSSVRTVVPLGVTKRIYNLSPIATPGHTWISVVRDKFGLWFAQTLGSASSSLEVMSVAGGVPVEDFSNVTRIQVDKDTGLTLAETTLGTGTGSNPLAGPKIEGLAAGATQMGMVTTKTQSFAGQKSFNDAVIVNATGALSSNKLLTVVDGTPSQPMLFVSNHISTHGINQKGLWVQSSSLAGITLGTGGVPDDTIDTWIQCLGPGLSIHTKADGSGNVVGSVLNLTPGLLEHAVCDPFGVGPTATYIHCKNGLGSGLGGYLCNSETGLHGTLSDGTRVVGGIIITAGTGGGGTITGVTAGTGLTGGGTSGTVTVGIAAGGVGTTELASGAVTLAKMNSGAGLTATLS